MDINIDKKINSIVGRAIGTLESDVVFSSGPKWKRTVQCNIVARDGSSITYDVILKIKVEGTSSSFNGYPINWSASINGHSSGTLKLKGSERWYHGDGYRTFTTRIKVTSGIGSGGGTASLTVKTIGVSNSNGEFSKTYTIDVSTWNTAPYWGTGASAKINLSGTVPENTGSITVSWTGASDNEGNTRYYQVLRYINGTQSGTVTNSTTATSVTDNISGYGQGTKIHYVVKVNDGSLWASTQLTTNTITKNTFTTATVSQSGQSIGFGTSAITLSYSGAKNTNGNGSFTYTLSSSQVTVYNASAISGGSITVSIYKSGTTPTTPYIKFEDLKTYLKGSKYIGNISFTLKTANAYGSSGTKSVSVSANIQTNPTALTVQGVTGSIVVGSKSYFIPRYKNLNVLWSPSRDELGGSITYTVEGKVSGGSYKALATGISATESAVAISGITTQTDFYVRVKAETSYGKYVYSNEYKIVLHDHRPPTINFTSVVRNQTSAVISGNIVLNTTITDNTITSATYNGKGSGSLTLSSGSFSVTESITELDAYKFVVTVQDTIGGLQSLTAVTKETQISRYKPVFSIRERGVGVNTVVDGSQGDAIFVVDGKSKVKDLLIENTTKTNITLQNTANAEGTQPRIIFKTVPSSEQGVHIRLNDYDSTRAPFGLHIERSDDNTQTTNKAYLDVQGDIYSNGQRVLTGSINSMDSKGNLNVQTGRTQGLGNVYSYNTVSGNTGAPTTYTSVMGFGRGTAGTVEICGEWTSGQGLWVRALRDTTDNWFPWQRVYTTAYKPTWNDIQSKPSVLLNDGSGGRLTLSNWYYSTGNTGWYNSTYDGGWYMQDTSWVRVWANKGVYTGGTIKSDSQVVTPKLEFANNDNITYDDTNNIFNFKADDNVANSKIRCGYLWSGSASGAECKIAPTWSGSKGTEFSFYNTLGNGWGFIGNSGAPWYRVYGTSGSISLREKKYDIQKYDTGILYDYVKNLGVYGYRSISTNIDEETGNETKFKRSDFYLGTMIQELPTEAVIYDEEGGDGKAVDNYGYSTMILGATQEVIKKVEILERSYEVLQRENEELRNKIEKLEDLINGFIEGR